MDRRTLRALKTDNGVGLITNENFLATFKNPSTSFLSIIGMTSRHKIPWPPKYVDRQLVSIYNIGCLIGAFINVFVGEWSGRRKAIWAAMFLIALGAVLQCSAFNVSFRLIILMITTDGRAQVGQLMLGRVITGIGVGIDTSTVPM